MYQLFCAHKFSKIGSLQMPRYETFLFLLLDSFFLNAISSINRKLCAKPVHENQWHCYPISGQFLPHMCIVNKDFHGWPHNCCWQLAKLTIGKPLIFAFVRSYSTPLCVDACFHVITNIGWGEFLQILLKHSVSRAFCFPRLELLKLP